MLAFDVLLVLAWSKFKVEVDKVDNDAVSYLRALLYLRVAELSGDGSSIKLESILSQAGISTKEIALLLGKTEVAVAKAISRARLAKK